MSVEQSNFEQLTPTQTKRTRTKTNKCFSLSRTNFKTSMLLKKFSKVFQNWVTDIHKVYKKNKANSIQKSKLLLAYMQIRFIFCSCVNMILFLNFLIMNRPKIGQLVLNLFNAEISITVWPNIVPTVGKFSAY